MCKYSVHPSIINFFYVCTFLHLWRIKVFSFDTVSDASLTLDVADAPKAHTHTHTQVTRIQEAVDRSMAADRQHSVPAASGIDCRGARPASLSDAVLMFLQGISAVRRRPF